MGIMNKMKTVALKDLTWGSNTGTMPASSFYATRTLTEAKPFGLVQLSDDSMINKSAYNHGIYIDNRPGIIIVMTQTYNTVAELKAVLEDVYLTYETQNAVEEKIVSNPTFLKQDITWGNTWNVVKTYLNSLAPGTYDIILRATLRQKGSTFDSKPNMWGIYTGQNRRYQWDVSAKIGDTVEQRDTLSITTTDITSLYAYGCGNSTYGPTGTADIELIIINPYTEEII